MKFGYMPFLSIDFNIGKVSFNIAATAIAFITHHKMIICIKLL